MVCGLFWSFLSIGISPSRSLPDARLFMDKRSCGDEQDGVEDSVIQKEEADNLSPVRNGSLKSVGGGEETHGVILR